MPLIFFAFPFVEFYLLIKLGQSIGAFNTLAFVVLSSVVGVALVRMQGARVLAQAQVQFAQGQLPEKAMRSGMFLFLAGVLFIIPGLLTNILAVALLIPWVQSRFVSRCLSWSTRFYQPGYQPYQGRSSGPRTFDAEYFETKYEVKEDEQKNIDHKNL